MIYDYTISPEANEMRQKEIETFKVLRGIEAVPVSSTQQIGESAIKGTWAADEISQSDRTWAAWKDPYA